MPVPVDASGVPPASTSAFALIATGGTGGHIYPALALADALVARGHPREGIRFVGATRGIEGTVVRDAGYHIDLLPGRGLQRRLTLANLGVARDACRALVGARRLVRSLRPSIVVGFGGYASLPAVVAARAARIPTLVHEQDAAPGLANRIGVRLGARAAVSLPNTPLPHARRTGNPVRAAFVGLARHPVDPPLVAFVGGSLGAATINRCAIGLARRWADRRDVAVRHVSGPRNHEQCSADLAAVRHPGDALDYELVAYEDDVPGLYSRATLVVARAGAGTVAELAAAGVPAVLVPLPGSPSDHQTHNARTLEAAGAAVHLPDAECTPERVDALVREILDDRPRLRSMSAAALGLARPRAADDLAAYVEELAAAGGRQEP